MPRRTYLASDDIVPTVLTTVLQSQARALIKGLQAMHPEQKPIGPAFIDIVRAEHDLAFQSFVDLCADQEHPGRYEQPD